LSVSWGSFNKRIRWRMYLKLLSVKPPICRPDLVSSKIYEPRTAVSNPYQLHHEVLAEHYPRPSK
jgi:hypothetical protein